MEAIGEILKTMRLSGAVFLDSEFTAPWRIISQVNASELDPMMPATSSVIAYHYLVEGGMWVRIGDEEPKLVEAGQLIIFPRNDAHQAGSTEDIEAIHGEKLIEPAGDDGLMRIRHGGGGDRCKIYCGYLGNSESKNPLIESLPPMMLLDLEDKVAGGWIEESLRFAVRQLLDGGQKAATELNRLAELLLAEAVREYVETLSEEDRGWLAALKDPVLGKALTLLHSQTSRDWSLETLSQEVAISRSSLGERFKLHLGVSPIRYLHSRRLQTAANELLQSSEALATIGFSAGYESEAAFNRAFKREFGLPPAEYRKANQGASA